MLRAVKIVICALCGAVLGLGANIAVNHAPRPSFVSARSPAGFVIRIGWSKAEARGTKKTRRRARHKAAALEAERKRLEARQKELLGTETSELPFGCAYDSYASAVNSTDIYTCGGNYYEKSGANGAAGFVGHPVGMDRKEIKRAMARQAEEDKEREAEAKKKREEDTKTALSSDCAYDSYASFSAATNVYDCGGVQFHETQEDGTTVYVRGPVNRKGGKPEGTKEPGAKVESKGRPAAAKKPPPRRADLPKGCAFDTYASFFTSSNVYNCNGTRYRQVQEKGTVLYEKLNL